MFSRPSTLLQRIDLLIRDFCSPAALQTLKPKSAHDRKNTFLDFRKIQAIGGNGGRGCISFMKLFCNPDAGPDGGDGGNGGHVLLRADPEVKSLGDLHSSRILAWDGQPGLGKHCHGAQGEHVIVSVPLGTTVRDESGSIIVDLDVPGIQFLAARGGAGGRGNNFYLSNENRHPRVCQAGAQGEKKTYFLEMKMMANAGLVGFPNAGKSSLLQAVSRAKPKVASYPFTTLKPHVGVIEYDDYEQLVLADLPGIIEGAHKNRGLGLEFLKHAERCACLLYVVDINEDEFLQRLKILQHELECYEAGFSGKLSIVVANKVDLLNSSQRDERVRLLASKCNLPVVPISAKFGTNLTALLNHMRKLYDETKKQIPAPVCDTLVV